MATNLDVDLAALDDLLRLGGFRSKREAVDAAVREAIAYRRQLKALDVLGAIEFQAPQRERPAEGGAA
jgi:Arc/MetJ family transcription regulator